MSEPQNSLITIQYLSELCQYILAYLVNRIVL